MPGPEPVANVRPSVEMSLQERELAALAKMNASIWQRAAAIPIFPPGFGRLRQPLGCRWPSRMF